MRTKNIQTINIWSEGVNVPINVLGLKISNDNLVDTATFQYSLFNSYDPTSYNNTPISSGFLVIDGQDYIDWGDDDDINESAIVWVANKLNLNII